MSVCSAAKLVVMVRWSIHDDTRSMNGTIQNSPGPRSPMNRPSRRTTARSHCFATRAACIRITPTTVITITGIGFPAATVPTSPRAIGAEQDQGRDHVQPAYGDGLRAATGDERGHYGFSFSPVARLGALRAQGADHIVEREAGRIGVGQHAGDEGPQAAIVLARWMRPRGAGSDKRSDAAPGLR